MSYSYHIYTQAQDKASALVTSLSDTTPVDPTQLVLGDTPTLNLYFTNGTAAEAWSGDASYGVDVGLGQLGNNPALALTSGSATAITGGFSIALPISGIALNSIVHADWFSGKAYTTLWLQVRVTTPAGTPTTYLEIPIQVRYQVLPLGTVPASQSVSYITAAQANAIFAKVADNLSDLDDAEEARENLGLGDAATQNAADLPVSTAQQAALDLIETESWFFSGRTGTINRVMDNPATMSRSTSSTITSAVSVLRTDPAFRYTGGNWTSLSGGFPNDQLYENQGLTGATNYYSGEIEFMHDGSAFEIALQEFGGAGIRVKADGAYVSLAPTLIDTSPGTYPIYHKVDFGTVAKRHIVIEWGYRSRFNGLRVGPNDTVSPVVHARRPRCILIGDSYAEGSTVGNGYGMVGYAKVLGRLLNWDVWNNGSGGTGLLTTNGTRYNYGTRVPTDVIPYAPEIVIVQFSRNDSTPTQSQIQAAGEALFDQIREGLPDVQLYAIGPFYDNNTAIPSQLLGVRAGAIAACASRNVAFVDTLEPGNEFITGIRTVPATGNAINYVASDNVHYTIAGHEAAALFVAQGICAAEGVDFKGAPTVNQVGPFATLSGGVVPASLGGTGVANTGTITLGGSLTTSGANALTFTTTSATNVTLPTTGTLATLAGSEALTNKTISGASNTLSNLNPTNLATGSGAVALTAGGSNQDVVVTASGTGRVRLGNGTTSGVMLELRQGTGSSYSLLFSRSASDLIGSIDATVIGGGRGLDFFTNAGASTTLVRAARLTDTQRLLLGTTTDNGTDRLQVSGSLIADTVKTNGTVRLKAYTVATLPAGTAGDMAYVTDATTPTYLGALTGGGTVACPVFYNGSAWVSH